MTRIQLATETGRRDGRRALWTRPTRDQIDAFVGVMSTSGEVPTLSEMKAYRRGFRETESVRATKR